MERMSTIRKDFLASHLRNQLNRLRSVLNNLEDGENVERDYTYHSLHEIENNLKQIRKLCMCN